MRKNRLLPIISIFLLLVAVFLTVLKPSGNIKKELRDFAVEDTARITKVFLGDRSGNTVTVVRGNDMVWRVNDSLVANKETLARLLQVIRTVQVKSRVAKAAYNNVIGDLSSAATKVEIYLGGDEPAKVYYVGGHTQDALGTFMIMEQSSEPFITDMPGFNGYLTPWYPTRLEDWRQNVVFDVGLSQIDQVSVEYPSFKDRSFSITRKDSVFLLHRLVDVSGTGISMKGNSPVNYLIHFERLPFMQEARMLGKRERDSLDNCVPLAIVSVKTRSGDQKSVSLYPMPISDQSLVKEDDKGKPLEFDLDHMYCRLPTAPFWVVVQHYTFDPILQKYGELGKIASSTE